MVEISRFKAHIQEVVTSNCSIIHDNKTELERRRAYKMKSADNGRVEFESRKEEIEPIMEILDQWMAKHPDDEKQEVAMKLFHILDFIHMTW